LVPPPRPTAPKKFIEIGSKLAEMHCKMSLHAALSSNVKEYWKMIQDPGEKSGSPPKSMDYSLGQTPPHHKISSKSVCDF